MINLDIEKDNLAAHDLAEEISSIEAEINRNVIMKHFKTYSEDPENVNIGQVLKTLNQILPKFKTSVPTAKKDHMGKIENETEASLKQAKFSMEYV